MVSEQVVEVAVRRYLADPAVRSGCRAGFPGSPVLHRLTGSEAQEIAECFISARTKPDSLVAAAYQRPRCTTSLNGRRLGFLIGASGRSAG